MQLLLEALMLSEKKGDFEPGSSQSLIFSALLNKLGDNNQRTREKAEEILISMAVGKCFGSEKVVSHIL